MRACERGQVLVVVALAFVALLGFAALAVDVGYMYTVRHELQRCADAGALAGASGFIPSVNPPIAILRAQDYASRDAVGTSPLVGATEVLVTYLPPDRIRVDTHRTVNLFFARIFGWNNTTVAAYAIAGVETVGPGTTIPRLVE